MYTADFEPAMSNSRVSVCNPHIHYYYHYHSLLCFVFFSASRSTVHYRRWSSYMRYEEMLAQAFILRFSVVEINITVHRHDTRLSKTVICDIRLHQSQVLRRHYIYAPSLTYIYPSSQYQSSSAHILMMIFESRVCVCMWCCELATQPLSINTCIGARFINEGTLYYYYLYIHVCLYIHIHGHMWFQYGIYRFFPYSFSFYSFDDTRYASTCSYEYLYGIK